MKAPTIIKTSDDKQVRESVHRLYAPPPRSHKGQNGKLLIIGGSSLFHAPPLWAAEVASHIVDMVHIATPYENMRILTEYKKHFKNGIVVSSKSINEYAKEDDVVLIGSGMMRGEVEEGRYTARTTRNLLEQFPEKRFVLDAGSLQTMKPVWLESLKTKAILTPHQLEFEKLFGLKLLNMSLEKKAVKVAETAKKYQCVLLVKTVIDIVSDGETTYVIEGGNAGLTKGGSGDILAGLTASLYTRNEPLLSALCASVILKRTADELYKTLGYWYNMDRILGELPRTTHVFS